MLYLKVYSSYFIKERSDFLIKANKAYRMGQPIISDPEYDIMEEELRSISPTDPALIEIDDCDFGVEKKLTIHMGSQDKASNLEGMARFYNRIDTNEWISASEKMDGMSAELTYKKGNLVQVLSRGDGTVGVDITSMVKGAKDVPLCLPIKEALIVIRGEIIIKKSDLVELNKELMRDNRNSYQNTRNGTVGLVKTLKNRKYSKFLSFRAFDIIGVN